MIVIPQVHFFIAAFEGRFDACATGADPGVFLGGGALLRNDVTDEKRIRIYEYVYKSEYVYTKKQASSQGGVRTPPHPSPRSAPVQDVMRA